MQMESWNKSLHEDQWRNRRENPSFSSSLLDAIYRSIDEDNEQEQKDQFIFCRESMKKHKQSKFLKDEVASQAAPYRRAHLVEKKVSEKVSEFDHRSTQSDSSSMFLKSNSSSSDSSSGGGFSSSESESFYTMLPKPIRTSVSSMKPEKAGVEVFHGYGKHSSQVQKPRSENGFLKTKSKALRILYGDLKKAKHPYSPGTKLASFLNSLFTAGSNGKKAKVSSSCGYEAKSAKSTSTCSSASSFSRSCLSKTPSTRSGTKRSVRFCPVSVVVDEDCRPCGHKNLYEAGERRLSAAMSGASYRRSYENNNNEALRFYVLQESLRVEKAARELLKKYHHQKSRNDEVEFDMHYGEEEDGDDDVASCASSDLFELDSLSPIGIERYREELPVFETTHFHSNQAIANGFIL